MWELRDYAERSAYRRRQYGEGPQQRADTAPNTARPPRAGSRTEGCAEPAARCQIAVMQKHTALHYWLFYTSQGGRGHYSTVRAGMGMGSLLEAPLFSRDPQGQKGVGKRGPMHKEALGDFNQALATRGRTRGPDSGLDREEMAPGKVKERGLRSQGAQWSSPILG